MTPSDVASSLDISVVSPVYGCAGCLEELVERTIRTLTPITSAFEILLVDDGSPDGSWSRIVEISQKYGCVKGLQLSRNFGQHAAISAGLSKATGKKIVVLDCDLQDQPEEIPSLLNALSDGAKIALASREQRQDGTLKRTGSKWFYKALGWLTDTSYDHRTANFGAYTRQVIETVNSMPEADRFFPLIVRWSGYSTVTVPVTHSKRTSGESSYTLSSLLRLASRVVFSFSDKPLRLIVGAGLTLSFLALIIVALSIYHYLTGSVTVAGFTSIIASVWLLGGATIASVGLVGLYVGRIFNQSKQRPNFVISESTYENINPL